MLWTVDTRSVWLRRPLPDAFGLGQSLLVRCTPAPPPPTLRPTRMQRLESVLGRAETMAVAGSSSHYRWTQAVAPWLTLPDLAMGGRTAVRKTAEASSFAARAGARAAQSSTRAQSAARDLRLTIAEGTDGRTIHAAALEAQKRAERFRLMQKLVRRANSQVLFKRNAVVAAAGGVWAARQYVDEPPKLVEEELDRLKGGREHGREGITAPVRSRTTAHLLAPARPHPSGAHANLHVMTMVNRASACR